MGTAGVQRAASKPPVPPKRGQLARGKLRRQQSKAGPAVTSAAAAVVPFSSRVSSKSKISSKGQITVPMLVRERLGVKAGDQIEFFFDGERTVVRPVRSEESPFKKWIGIARAGPSFDVDEWISEMRDDDERRADLAEIRRADGR